MNKKIAQILHAKKRFRERYGKNISDAQLLDLQKDVKLGYCQEIAKVSCSRKIYKSGEWIFCYDNKRKQVCTFLTEDMIPRYIQKEHSREQRISYTGAKNYNNKTIESINQELLTHISK